MGINLTKFEVVLMGMIMMLLVFTYMIESKTVDKCNIKIDKLEKYMDKECVCTENSIQSYGWKAMEEMINATSSD